VYMNKLGRKFWLTLMIFGALALTAISCDKKGDLSKDLDAVDDEGLPAKIQTGVKPQADSEVAVIDVNDYGRIVIELYPNVAPKMVERFKKLISEHFYDGVTFHRIDPQLGIVQGGDPLSKDSNPANDGTGDSPYPNVPGEFSDIPYERGTVGAARKGGAPGDKLQFDTANCQFFITVKPQPAFDKKYTVFGRVIDGIKNAEIIMGAPVKEGSERPDPDIVIKSVTLQPRSGGG
jgi:cyclophilin family peptidyl-prolyl cis-trans isomerase